MTSLSTVEHECRHIAADILRLHQLGGQAEIDKASVLLNLNGEEANTATLVNSNGVLQEFYGGLKSSALAPGVNPTTVKIAIKTNDPSHFYEGCSEADIKTFHDAAPMALVEIATIGLGSYFYVNGLPPTFFLNIRTMQQERGKWLDASIFYSAKRASASISKAREAVERAIQSNDPVFRYKRQDTKHRLNYLLQQSARYSS
jgi:hypothetical protein